MKALTKEQFQTIQQIMVNRKFESERKWKLFESKNDFIMRIKIMKENAPIDSPFQKEWNGWLENLGTSEDAKTNANIHFIEYETQCAMMNQFADLFATKINCPAYQRRDSK